MDTATILQIVAVPIIVGMLGSAGFAAFVNYRIEVSRENRKKKETNPTEIGVRLLLQDRIEWLCIKYLGAGEVKWSDLKWLRQAYADYKLMKGNGDLDELIENVEKLKVIYPEKK